jgi:hypothetical protein
MFSGDLSLPPQPIGVSNFPDGMRGACRPGDAILPLSPPTAMHLKLEQLIGNTVFILKV